MRLDGTMTMRWFVSVCWVLLITIAGTANAILPTAEIEVYVGNDEENSYTVLASQASFGPLSPMAGRTTQDAVQLQFPPSDNPLLCNNDTVEVSVSVSVSVSVTAVVYTEPTILMVPRGDCTYQFKAWQAQQLGAQGVILYNTLASRYSLNTTKSTKSTASTASTATSDDILFPQEFFDYDCQLGQAEIPSVDLSFDPLPYNSQQNDPLLSGDASSDNLCWLYSQNHLNSCDSKKCLITGANTNATFTNKDTDTDTDTDTTQTKVCCAWDLHLWLYSDTTMKDYTKVTIPTVFITMNQADTLFESMSKGPVLVKLYSRWRSSYNLSSILIWMLGVAVASLAAYCSAHDYHTGIRKLLARRNATSSTIPTGRAPRQPQPLAHRNPMQEETLELEPIHALGFVIMASSSLFILFYFEIYNVVKVMYAIGCSNAVVQVIVSPLVAKLMVRLNQKQRLVYKSSEFGDITNWDVFSIIIGYSWGMTWLYMALFVHHTDTIAFFWITQDVLGACMCIVFLGLIQLNSIQVASILLVVAFFYDIFFVFVTPYLFQKSIMITVATSGGPPKADPLWCEKYPNDKDCQGGDPLPMLMTIPRLLDYQGGSSLLGLGDIVLPGLLLSFAARLDAAKKLVAIVSGGRNEQRATGQDCDTRRCCCSKGYFVPLVIAYAIGLLMANVAVYVMNMGQPALLYLVPCTLGTMCVLGHQNHELKQLWDGPRILQTADQIVYGRPVSTTTTTGAAAAAGADSTIAEEFVDDEAGEVPLLSTTNLSKTSNPSPPSSFSSS